MTDAPAPAPEAPPAGAEAPPADRGFPEATRLEDMTDAQKAAYWQHYARKHEDTVKSFKGLTPQQIADLQSENETLKTAQLSASDKALKTARDEAAQAAADAAKAEYLPQIQALQVKAAVSALTQDEEQTNGFMVQTNPAAFFNDKGEFDQDKLMGVCTAIWGAKSAAQTQNAGPRWQNAGQYTAPPPGAKPGENGTAEAAKRFGKKPT